MSDWLVLGTACVLGVLHALELDHMVAVTVFVSRRPDPAAAARFGARWGIGHSLAVLAAGAVLLVTGVRIPARFDAAGETVVGLMLLGLGAWALLSARKLHLHSAEEHGGHAHVHLHSGAHGEHEHPHRSGADKSTDHTHGSITLVGLLHGLAGTSGVVALVPVTLMDRATIGLGYLAAFGVGVTLAMTIFALVAAIAVRRASRSSLVWGRRIVEGIAVAAIGVGGWWIARAG